MAYCGVRVDGVTDWLAGDLRRFAIYWGLFFLSFLASLYFAMLDVRYNLAQYAAAKRQVFLQTLGDEEFRKALRAAQHQQGHDSDESRDSSS
jgi:hypothetical protein